LPNNDIRNSSNYIIGVYLSKESKIKDFINKKERYSKKDEDKSKLYKKQSKISKIY
jgi:hypothetical protein